MAAHIFFSWLRKQPMRRWEDICTFLSLFPWLSRVHSSCSCDFRYSQESNFAVFSGLVGGDVFVILGADVSYNWPTGN